MILKDIVQAVEWTDVLAALILHYPEDIGRYPQEFTDMFRRLQEVQPTEQDQVLSIDVYPDTEHDGEGSAPADVSGYDGEQYYAWEYSPWADWLGIQIIPETRQQFDDAEIVAHCMTEMSFFGFDEGKIEDRANEITRRAEEATKHPERLIPAEEAIQRIRETLDEIS